jgi:hypothetical protein
MAPFVSIYRHLSNLSAFVLYYYRNRLNVCRPIVSDSEGSNAISVLVLLFNRVEFLTAPKKKQLGQMLRLQTSSSDEKSAQGKSAHRRTMGNEHKTDKGILQIPFCSSKLPSSFTFYHFASISVLQRSVLRSVIQFLRTFVLRLLF